MAKVGAIGKWDDNFLVTIPAMAKKGLTNQQIAKNLGIEETTFYAWLRNDKKNNESQISQALKIARGSAVQEVENAMFKIAKGYEYEEVAHTTGSNSFGPVNERKVTTKMVNPSATAQIFILKNKRHEDYKDKVHQEISLAKDLSDFTFNVRRHKKPTIEKGD